MDTVKFDVEALNVALKMEHDGREFFLAAKDKASHPLAKETFASLADWELEHIRIIEKYRTSLEEKGQWESVDDLGEKKGETIASFRTAFQKARENMDETVKADADSLEAYRVAKDIEDKLVVFYTEKAGQTGNENAKVFYNFMANQERQHFTILDNSYKYLEDSSLFFTEEEGWMFDGG